MLIHTKVQDLSTILAYNDKISDGNIPDNGDGPPLFAAEVKDVLGL